MKLSITFFLLFSNIFQAQIINENYYEIGGNGGAKVLRIENDSIIKITPYRTHLLNSGTEVLKYTKSNNLILIHTNNGVEEFQIINNALVNFQKKIVYVLRKDFKKDPTIYVHYKGKFNEVGKIDKELKRRLKKKDNDLKINVVKGFDAYEKYGYKYSFGVIEIN